MLDTTRRTLKLLASMVWYSGAVVMYVKSAGMLLEALDLRPGYLSICLAIAAGLIIGVIKAKYLFKRLCLSNMKRIDSLVTPKLWQFYRPRFFMFLLTMVVLGLMVSAKAHGNYMLLISMAVIEISIATALLATCNCFWKKISSNI